VSDSLLVIIILELLAVVALLVVLDIDLARQARKIEAKLELIRQIVFVTKPGGHHGFDNVGPCGPFAIWCYTKGRWILLNPCGQPGCDCGPPPTPGTYEEQVIRKECPQPIGQPA